MARRLHFCDALGATWKELVYPDNEFVPTAMGELQADQLAGSTKALITVIGAGGDPDGNVDVSARHGGSLGNSLRFSIETGPTGAGNENLLLRASRVGSDISVFFATDGAGASITATAQQVADTITNDADASGYLTAVPGGTGAANAGTSTIANLLGGVNYGEHYKIDGRPPSLVRINTVDVE